MATRGHVLVVDAANENLGYVHPAVARRALRERRAELRSRDPLVIQVAPGETALRGVMSRSNAMNLVPTTPAHDLNAQRGASMQSWMRFFQEEREIWLQNISPYNHTINFSMAGTGGVDYSLSVPVGTDPICLNQEVTWEAIRTSQDLRRYLNRRDLVRIMEMEEAEAYFVNKARAAHRLDPVTQQPDVQWALADADERRRKSRQLDEDGTPHTSKVNGKVTFAPPKSARELAALQQGVTGIGGGVAVGAGGTLAIDHGAPITLEEAVQPAVLNLCQQVSTEIPEGARMPAEALLEQLKIRVSTLTEEDLSYVQSNGGYRAVRRWAESQLRDRERARQDALEGPEEDGEV